MTSRSKILLGLAAAAALMSGCATDPYYNGYSHDNSYAYNNGYYTRDGYYYDRAPTYYYSPGYYPRYYVAPPSVSLGFSYGRRWH